MLFEDLDDDPAPPHSEHKWEIRIHAYAAVTKHGRSKLILAAGTSIKALGALADAKADNADEYVRVLEHGWAHTRVPAIDGSQTPALPTSEMDFPAG